MFRPLTKKKTIPAMILEKIEPCKIIKNYKVLTVADI